MKEPEMLRALARDVRAQAVKQAEDRRNTAAATLVAATGLGMLTRKLGGICG
jgi:hypothetical protein